jgi:hypothetical protein
LIGLAADSTTASDHRLRLARHIDVLGVLVSRRGGQLQGSSIEMVVAETVQVAHGAYQVRALRRARQPQGHGFFQPFVLEPPVHVLAAVQCAHVA